MTQFEAEALFEIVSLLKDIKIRLKSIDGKLDRLTERVGDKQ